MEQRTTLSQSIEIVEKYIVGNPKVGAVSVLPDETTAPKVTGVGVEDSTVNEGVVTYDIQFHAILPNVNEIVFGVDMHESA